MAKRKRIRDEAWFAIAFVAILVFALIADWWKGNGIFGWIIVTVLLIIVAFLAYRYGSVRGWLGR